MIGLADADTVNAFARHPDIEPSIGAGIDLTPATVEPNVALFGEHGGFCFVWHGPGVYEVHVMITRAGRGKWGVMASREAIRQMKTRGMAQMWARVHPDRPEISAYAVICGMRDTGAIVPADFGAGLIGWRIYDWRA